jgi:hypothetical protein
VLLRHHVSHDDPDDPSGIIVRGRHRRRLPLRRGEGGSGRPGPQGAAGEGKPYGNRFPSRQATIGRESAAHIAHASSSVFPLQTGACSVIS